MVVVAARSAVVAAAAGRGAASGSGGNCGRALLLASVGAGRRRPRPGGAFEQPHQQQVRAFHVPMPWDGRRKAREDGELQTISRMETALKALDGPLSLAADSPFRGLVEEKGRGAGAGAGAGAEGETPKKEEFQQWLGAAEAELGLLAKAQMGVFDGGEWWVEGHVDAANATQALHCLRLQHLCGELKKSKAVFTPHLPGDRLIPGAVGRVVQLLRADMDGDLEGRLRAAWALLDYDDPMQQKPLLHPGGGAEPPPSSAPPQPDITTSSGSGSGGSALLSEQAAEDAIYTSLNPTVGAAAALYPALPGVTKAQRKAFAKFVKFYTRDQADFPTKLRCIFHWAERPPEPQLATPPPVPPPKVVSLDAWLAMQKENFPDLLQVGAGVPQLYKRVREARFHTKSEDRQTFRTGLVYLVGLGVADVFVCSL